MLEAQRAEEHRAGSLLHGEVIMDWTSGGVSTVHELYTRADTATPHRPPVFKAVGISLAIASGVFIGTSFVLKKTGLLRANAKYNEEAGEGYGYLKNAFWWTGMTLMILGEICNFVAYAFVDAILVTPLGALSVVITTILSAIFLKERLSFVGKIGCFLCIVGSVVILLSAPAQSSAGTIQEMQHFVIAPGFLTYAGIIILGCAFIAFWAGPRYGKKSMLVYLSICSLIGGLSVVATQGLGAAIVAQAGGTKQYNQPFLYILFVFVIATLLTEIIFLNVGLSHSLKGPVADKPTESAQHLQRSPSNANLLCLFHERYDSYLGDPLPRVQGQCSVDNQRGPRLLGYLLRCHSLATLKIGKRCSRYSSLQRRPGPSTRSGRATRA